MLCQGTRRKLRAYAVHSRDNRLPSAAIERGRIRRRPIGRVIEITESGVATFKIYSVHEFDASDGYP